ncbi:hypothetical protein D3C81_1270610 [compost metagenome]
MVVTVQVAGEPDHHRSANEQLQPAADIGADHRAAGIDGAQGTLAGGLVLALRSIRAGDPRFAHHDRIDERQQQAEHRHAGERPAPAEVFGENATQRHAEHRAEHAAGHERASQGRTHAAGEYREHHGDADAAVGCLPYADQEACDEHLLEAFRQAAAERRQAPQDGHQGQAPDPSPAIRHERQREGQQADHQGDDATEQAELRIGQRPLALEQREHRVEHLPRHVVGDQQAKGQCEHHPGVAARHAESGIIGVAGGDGVECHGRVP